jgi:rod shape-determining protein MreD
MMLDPRTVGTPPSTLARILFGLLLLIFAALQGAFAYRMALWGGQPDFILTLTLVAALLSDATLGCYVGFAGGLMTAAVASQTTGTYLVSRTIAGYVAGAMTARLHRGNIGVIFLVVLVASLVAHLSYSLAAPPRGEFLDWVRAVGFGALWNAVLSLPISFLLRRCGWGKGRM